MCGDGWPNLCTWLGVFTPGKSFSLLSLVRIKILCFFFWFDAVPFHVAIFKKSPIICQHTNQCAKIVQSLDKKVWGGVKRQRQKKMWKVPKVCESKQSWMSSAICFLELDRADVRALSSQIHHSLTKAPTVLYGKLSQQKTPAEILRHPLVSAWFMKAYSMSSVIDQYEDILTIKRWLN